MGGNRILKAAIRYWKELGWAVIPLIPKTKEPLVKWKKFQKRRPSLGQIQEWWRRHPHANIGIITGKISNLTVIDGDGEKAEAFFREKGGLPSTPTSQSKRGRHRYFRYPAKEKIPNRSFKEFGFDVKSEGGFIVAPPSIHPSGKQYRWRKGLSPFEGKPEELKGVVLELIKKNAGGEKIMKIQTSAEDWEKARKLISSYPKIQAHWNTPKPDDRSGHDWKLARLCIEKGIKDESILLQIILNNPYGKAKIRRDPEEYATKLIFDAKHKHPQQGSVVGARFPKEAIRGLAKDFADLYTQHLESPWEFWAFAFLTCLGSILADRITLKSQLTVQTRLFTILLGESAIARKSECLKQTMDFFKAALPHEFSTCLGVGSAEGLAEQLQSEKKTLLVFDEFKVFVSKAVARGAILLPCVNTLFEENDYQVKTKGHSINVKSGFLSILGASTTDTFSQMFTSAFTDIGFITRLWLVPGETEHRFPIPRRIQKKKMDALKDRLVKLVNSVPNGTTLKLSSGARDAFSKWYRKTPVSIYRKRLDTYGHRLMILFCVNEGKEKVTRDVAERVIQLLECQEIARKMNDPIDAEGRIARAEVAIRRSVLSGSKKERDLKRKVHYERIGISIWKTAISNLKQAKEIVYSRKRKVYSPGENFPASP